MSEKVKLIIEIPKDEYKDIKDHEQMIRNYPTTSLIRILNGIPLDDVKAEIDQLPLVLYAGYDHIEKDSVMQILDNIGNAESIDPNDMTCMFEGVTEVPNDAFKGWHTDELLEQIRKKNNDNPEDTGCDHND